MGDGFPFFDIILFAMLAGFLIFRLRSVLGRRTGHERQRPNPLARQSEDGPENDNVIQLPGQPEDEADDAEFEEVTTTAAGGLMRIKAEDPNFDEVDFLRGSRAAFEMVVNGFANGDADSLRDLLSDDLHGGFASAIDAREAAGETQETTIASIKSADIVDASLQDGIAIVTIEFISDQVKVTRDAEGEVIEGDPDRIDTLTDIWSFARDVRQPNPNWLLVATREPED